MDHTSELWTSRLVLTSLTVSDAADMEPVLADRELYEFMGGDPPSLARLEARYRVQVAGSGMPNVVWHNWIIRLEGEPVGFVQATVYEHHADVAWVVGVPWQGRAIAQEAAAAMCDWLRASGVPRLNAHIHPDHVASERVAAAVGMIETDTVDEDGEVIWTWPPPPSLQAEQPA